MSPCGSTAIEPWDLCCIEVLMRCAEVPERATVRAIGVRSQPRLSVTPSQTCRVLVESLDAGMSRGWTNER